MHVASACACNGVWKPNVPLMKVLTILRIYRTYQIINYLTWESAQEGRVDQSAYRKTKVCPLHMDMSLLCKC